jgi:Pep3/Vps18/deep orange family
VILNTRKCIFVIATPIISILYLPLYVGQQVGFRFRINIVDSMDFLGSGIYHGMLNFKSSSENFLDTADLLPYPIYDNGNTKGATPNVPISICCTEFHFVYLFPDRVVAVGILDHRQDYEEQLAWVCCSSCIIHRNKSVHWSIV